MLEIDGHKIAEIEKALDQAEAHRGKPFCIVAHTVKGKGVSFMENNPEWHGKAPKPAEAIAAIREILGVPERTGPSTWAATPPPERSSTSSAPSSGGKPMPAKATRAAFGEALLELAERHDRIVTAGRRPLEVHDDGRLRQEASPARVQRRHRRAEHDRRRRRPGPDRLDPLRVLLRLFRGRPLRDDPDVRRLHERQRQARRHPCRNRDRRGRLQPDGAGGRGLLRALPNIPIIQPADELETKQAVAYAVEHDGPLYLRLTRQNLEPVSPPDYRFQLGRWLRAPPGAGRHLVGSGGPSPTVCRRPALLAADGISAEVVNASTIKPVDQELLLTSAGRTGHVVTVEDHAVAGGLGGAVAETLSEPLLTPLLRLGVRGFGESGDAKGLYAKHGLDPDGIRASVKKFVGR